MRDAGYADLGGPGPRPEYSPTYYGAFVADSAGNSIEAVHHQPRSTDGRTLDHLWLRTRNLEAATLFYEAIAPTVHHHVTRRPGLSRVHKQDSASFSLVPGESTENLHLAFAAQAAATVDAFHEAGVNAGFTSLGEPGERPHYHPGYYSAYLADRDLHNIEAVHHNRPLGKRPTRVCRVVHVDRGSGSDGRWIASVAM
jgi:catechol 2,3-dioxygenase-like lactoylglutathione lyase family enzyme